MTTTNKYRDILLHLAQAPEIHLDGMITPKLQELADQPVVESDDLLAIIDTCVHGALASPFAITALNAIWQSALGDEGKTLDEAIAAADVRRQALIAALAE